MFLFIFLIFFSSSDAFDSCVASCYQYPWGLNAQSPASQWRQTTPTSCLFAMFLSRLLLKRCSIIAPLHLTSKPSHRSHPLQRSPFFRPPPSPSLFRYSAGTFGQPTAPLSEEGPCAAKPEPIAGGVLLLVAAALLLLESPLAPRFRRMTNCDLLLPLNRTIADAFDFDVDSNFIVRMGVGFRFISNVR